MIGLEGVLGWVDVWGIIVVGEARWEEYGTVWYDVLDAEMAEGELGTVGIRGVGW